MAEILAGKDIADVDFDRRESDSRHRIAQGDAGMRIGAGIDDKSIEVSWHLVNPIDQLPLVVALAAIQGDSQFRRNGAAAFLNGSQRLRAIDAWFPHP